MSRPKTRESYLRNQTPLQSFKNKSICTNIFSFPFSPYVPLMSVRNPFSTDLTPLFAFWVFRKDLSQSSSWKKIKISTFFQNNKMLHYFSNRNKECWKTKRRSVHHLLAYEWKRSIWWYSITYLQNSQKILIIILGEKRWESCKDNYFGLLLFRGIHHLSLSRSSLALYLFPKMAGYAFR